MTPKAKTAEIRKFITDQVAEHPRDIPRLVDDGVGIFEKIRRQCKLDDHRQAILELSKGKLTTDPERHTGQGIFFTSRIFDEFLIRSDHFIFGHFRKEGDWLVEVAPKDSPG